jgi:hypothetical protein
VTDHAVRGSGKVLAFRDQRRGLQLIRNPGRAQTRVILQSYVGSAGEAIGPGPPTT